MRHRILGTVLEVTVPLALLGLWALLSADSETYYFPPLTDILDTFADTWLFERVGSDVVPSLVRLGLGYGIACVVAVALGLALGLSPAFRRALDPVVQFLRSIPPPALLPFGILVLGVGTSMKVFIIAFVCLWPVLLNTIDGVAGVDPTLRETARVYRSAAATAPARRAPGSRAADLRRHADEPVARAHPDGDLRDGREHERHRLLRAAVAAQLRDRRDVVGDPAAGDPGLPAERRVPDRRAARPAVAPRRARERPELKRTVMLHVEHLKKSYGDVQAIGDLSFDVDAGEFVCIVGPSGCGKTTLLKCVAGLLEPTAGEVRLEGAPVHGPPDTMALVFQEYSRSLFPWMTVRQNVAFPLRRKKPPDAAKRVEQALASVGLEGALDRYPWQLSGGMQQRVAIARALAYQPRILLMDEPFASVDAQTRADLEDLVLEVRRQYEVTIVFVTHDIDESVYLSDRIIVLGPSPTTVRETLDVGLPQPRDQVATKELPEFARLRAHVWRTIKRPDEAPVAWAS